jgi:hypothetical protein
MTMPDYYDGPRKGIALYNGKPHLYESRWTDIDTELEDTFLLMPLSSDIVELALEDWEIWLRWQHAFDRKEATIETHPALPEDRVRHNELAIILESKLLIDMEKSFCAKGIFKRAETTELLVKWEFVSCEDYLDQRQKFSL